ncbi:uncharacterized protein M6B38_122865 [Iris pallida]|uniref:Uncharacterized protein n=1 Tax=Iris pallida TaxID=29817 RepID=A0AAX6H2H4_IRIPA|nr:uncharacterized protein M6B38_122865 [Iris pallida]
MAPALPPNLADGQFWLPSAAIHDVLGAEALAHQLPSIGLLHPTHNPTPLGFRLMTRFEAARNGFGSISSRGFRVPEGTGAFLPLPRTASSQAGDARIARVLTKPEPVRFTPVRTGGGTGVFLPKVAYSYNDECKPKVKDGYGGVQQQQQQQTIRRAGGRKKEENVVKPLSTRLADSPADITLPQEWTY